MLCADSKSDQLSWLKELSKLSKTPITAMDFVGKCFFFNFPGCLSFISSKISGLLVAIASNSLKKHSILYSLYTIV